MNVRARVSRLEARLLPPTGPDIAAILRRRMPGEPEPPPRSAEEQARHEAEMMKSELGRTLLRRMRRVRDEAQEQIP